MYTNVLDNLTAIEQIPSVQPVCYNKYGLSNICTTGSRSTPFTGPISRLYSTNTRPAINWAISITAH